LIKRILGIESSCDDTGAAIVTSERKILSNIVISQNTEHAPFKGVVPEIAARSHMQHLEQAIILALQEANMELNECDAIVATSGPGLIGGVIVGSMFGRALASVLKKPFIAINHLEGHALTVRLTHSVPYPYLLLLASGGHCQFVAVLALGKYKILGNTLDDSVGEAFDKVAKMMGLPFPGGPHIETKAKLGDKHKYNLPKPIIDQDNCAMSFSGLKTAVRSLIIKLTHNIDNSIRPLDEQEINDISASFQYSIGEVLSNKMGKAINIYERLADEATFVISGGVAANHYLRTILGDKAASLGYNFIAPPTNLCTDNAAMVAYAGVERLEAGLLSPLNFCPRASWSLEDI
jgi:N6-L-threonylcarbamoyladenine synthase